MYVDVCIKVCKYIRTYILIYVYYIYILHDIYIYIHTYNISHVICTHLCPLSVVKVCTSMLHVKINSIAKYISGPLSVVTVFAQKKRTSHFVE